MKKKIIVTAIVFAVIILAGCGTVHYLVNFAFDKYFFGSAISSMVDENTEELVSSVQTQPEEQNEEQETEGQPAQSSDNAPVSQKKRFSKSEILSRVMKSSELTYKMASMVSYEDKKRVLQIVMSNFTTKELKQIAQNVSKGMTSEYKSKMMAEAQSRLTGAQWQECMSLAYKYVEQMRPYVE